MNETTPADLAREFGVDAKTIRLYLRTRYGKLSPPGRWIFSSAQADEVRNRFRDRTLMERYAAAAGDPTRIRALIAGRELAP